MDFYTIKERSAKNGVVEVFPDFRVTRSQDLMVRSKSFYAVWDQEAGMWSTDEYDVQKLIDADLREYVRQLKDRTDSSVSVKYVQDWSSGVWASFQSYVSKLSDSNHQLDEDLTFSNTPVKKHDYRSKRLPYPLEDGDISAYDELVGTLYDQEERAKLEWAVGSIVAGDAKDIQKFVVLYGEGGSGKSTFLNIVQSLFNGYYTAFEAKELTSNSNAFAIEAFTGNPLVAIQHDGDLSRIEDNSKLNSIVSHEEITFNEKFKPLYTARANCMLFMGTNSSVKITDSKSGLIRRLIDVTPSGNRVTPKRYQALKTQIGFELGAIAAHCLKTYREMGKDYYSGYKPLNMMFKTDIFYNYVEEQYLTFATEPYILLKQAYDMYKKYCDDALIEHKLPLHKFREELKNYFGSFSERTWIDGAQARNVYRDFLADKFTSKEAKSDELEPFPLVLDQEESLLDALLEGCPAQYATEAGTPSVAWADCTSTLGDIDTHRVHYVQVPENHIVIDFDLQSDDGSGEKSLERNLEAASKWPATYAETSKSGSGIHLHYEYEGDATELARLYAEGIEIKVFTGKSSLRRKVGKCNSTPVAKISSGLPKKEPKVINKDAVMSEKGLRELIERNLRKEIHPGTKPSIDFIYKILEDASKSGNPYDVSNLRPKVLAFANNSTHQAAYCLKVVSKMKFKSEEASEPVENTSAGEIVFYDVEVFPNLFVVCWKYDREDKNVVRMINPSPSEIAKLVEMKLVGFNNRKYDNHILYARYLGYDNAQLYALSKRLIGNSRDATFAEAYSLSYADIYDFSSKKQSLKRFEIELGIHHQELGLPWDEPVPEELWEKVAAYCDNDVLATQATFHAREEDFVARQILAELSGLTVNDTTQRHTARIIFGKDKRPQDKFVYTDLSEMFPGYEYSFGKSSYRGEDPSEGGYVYANPGMYNDVALIDVASMHPSSLINLNAFGEYTPRFKELMDARLAIKHGDFDAARGMLDGKLAPFLQDTSKADELAYALKIVINIVYGLTSAKFENPFKDPRNVDNIVAKRGALFMIDLKHFVQEKGFIVAHIKTDSIKIPNATPEIIEEVMQFGKKYGYNFEHEATYSKMCLVNNAVYAAKYGWAEKTKKIDTWETTGAQYQQPYVKKALFTKEPLEFKDLCETKTVTTALYLNMNENLPEGEDDLHFVGRAGLFCPVLPGAGGGLLMREKEGKYYAASGTKGYRWLESEMVETLGKQDQIDRSYYESLVEDAKANLAKYGDVEWFLS